ncbi:MAG: FliA/WhiG family RNA polymerase sigma factor [Firmicutes bacterium]|nr:FliA/WhiG family RNA polymerase sigma factor [Bacillota bacterium]
MITQERAKLNVWQEYSLTKDIRLRNEIILQYSFLVKLVVCRLMPNYKCCAADYDDFISYGTLGLIDAIEKYDTSRDVKFETYASIRIRGSIIDNIRKRDWLSSSLRQKIKRVETAFERMEAMHGRPATEVEVAGYLNMDLKELQSALTDSYLANIVYFDQLVANSTCQHMLANKTDLPEECFEKKEMKQILAGSINKLSKQERMVVTLYYFEEFNLKEIGLILGVSESRISQIHSKSLTKLRNSISKVIR